MQRKKLWILLTLVLSILFSGCYYEAPTNDFLTKPVMPPTTTTQPTTTTAPTEPFIGFAETKTRIPDELIQLKPKELETYISPYNHYNTYYYYEYLNDTEKLVYRAYEYAMDKGLPYFWIDERLLQDLERSTFQILEFLSLDSAVVEQNIARMQDTVTLSDGENYMMIFVEDFTKERLKNKDRAIMEAKIVMSRLYGQGAKSRRELAEYIYDYLGGCVGYTDDVDEYLYAAMCHGETNCDGYANAFALMCAIVDVPCIEVNSDTPLGEVGHTWNMVYLENKWVHVDATGATSDLYATCENREEQWVYFGFSDALLEYPLLYADMLPTCPEGLTSILHFSSNRIDGFYSKIKAEFARNDNKFAVVLLDQGKMDEQTISELIRELEFGLYYVTRPAVDGRTVYHLYNNEL